ncbi:cyanate hydratase [Panus rudis PR-1116 ss-1]|nr:cyanate hydratase [Panus rudis PR-1116 ss-1]
MASVVSAPHPNANIRASIDHRIASSGIIIEPFNSLPPILSTLNAAKAAQGLTFDAIGKAIGRSEVWVAAAFLGQAKFTQEELSKVSQLLAVDNAALVAELGDHWYPQRGIGPSIPTDPVIYRLYEGVLVYGQAIKSVIHEKFGDGIMSMIDCTVSVDKKEVDGTERVLLTFDGKFLPYKKW